MCRVPTLLLRKKSRTFPGPPREIFQDLFGAHECLNIKKKTLPSPPVAQAEIEFGAFLTLKYDIWW